MSCPLRIALVGQTLEVLCTGPSRHNETRLAGRTRGNKIAVFAGTDQLTGQLVDLDISETAGFTLYGANPRVATDGVRRLDAVVNS